MLNWGRSRRRRMKQKKAEEKNKKESRQLTALELLKTARASEESAYAAEDAASDQVNKMEMMKNATKKAGAVIKNRIDIAQSVLLRLAKAEGPSKVKKAKKSAELQVKKAVTKVRAGVEKDLSDTFIASDKDMNDTIGNKTKLLRRRDELAAKRDKQNHTVINLTQQAARIKHLEAKSE